MNCLTKLVSLLGGGFCLRFGDPDKQRNISIKCICNVLNLHPTVRNYVASYICASFLCAQRQKYLYHYASPEKLPVMMSAPGPSTFTYDRDSVTCHLKYAHCFSFHPSSKKGGPMRLTHATQRPRLRNVMFSFIAIVSMSDYGICQRKIISMTASPPHTEVCG